MIKRQLFYFRCHVNALNPFSRRRMVRCSRNQTISIWICPKCSPSSNQRMIRTCASWSANSCACLPTTSHLLFTSRIIVWSGEFAQILVTHWPVLSVDPVQRYILYTKYVYFGTVFILYDRIKILFVKIATQNKRANYWTEIGDQVRFL